MTGVALYKVLDYNRRSTSGDKGQWPELPNWTEPVSGRLHLYTGYHLYTIIGLVYNIGPTIWEAETGEEFISFLPYRVVARTARLIRRIQAWDKRNAVIFACDCVEHCLRQVQGPDDAFLLVEEIRDVALGKSGEKALEDVYATAGIIWNREKSLPAQAAVSAVRNIASYKVYGKTVWGSIAKALEAARTAIEYLEGEYAYYEEGGWQARHLQSILEVK